MGAIKTKTLEMSALYSRTTFLLIGLLLLTQSIFCQQSANLAQQDFLEEIEFEWIRGLIFIPVQIEGNTYRFILDTGGALAISTALQEQFSFEQVATANVVGINKLSKRVPYVKVPLVRLGSLEFSNYRAIVSDYSGYPLSCLAADGIIGRDFLRDLILELNLPEKKIKLSDNPLKLNLPKKGEIPVKIQRKSSLPYIKVEVAPFGKEWAVFDSGSDDLFSFKTKTIEKLRQKAKFREHPVETYFGVTSLGSSGIIPKPMAAYTTSIEKLQLGDAVMESFYADLSKRSRSRVGTGLMRYGIVTVDYQEKKFYFQPKESIQKATAMKRSMGFLPRFTGEAYIVSALQVGSEAEEKGLRLGDTLLQINDIDLRDIQSIDHCQLYLKEDKWGGTEETKLTFLSNGKEKTITVKRVKY